MTRVLLVGEAPAPRDRVPLLPGQPLTGPSGRRLARLAGISFWPAYLRRTERVNLLWWCPDEWDAKIAEYARQKAAEMPLAERRVVLCGRNVADAFGFHADWFTWVEFRGALVAAVPHPSARNRMWNDEAVVALASTFLAAALKET